MVRRFLLITALGAGLLFACKEEEKHPALGKEGNNPTLVGSGGGSTSSSGAIVDAGPTPDGGACTDLVLTGAEAQVLENGVQEAPLAGTGGTVANGTYDLTQSSRFVGASGFPGPTGTTYKAILRITAGTTYDKVQVQGSSSSTAVIEIDQHGVLQTASTNATLSLTCPSVVVQSLSYTATDTTLTLIDLEIGISQTYTLR
jgi:hypothetical protein